MITTVGRPYPVRADPSTSLRRNGQPGRRSLGEGWLEASFDMSADAKAMADYSGRTERGTVRGEHCRSIPRYALSATRDERLELGSPFVVSASIASVSNHYKLLALLLLPLSLAATPSITLKLTTLEGAALEQAAIGQPFLLNVNVIDASNATQYPTLKGIENFHVRQSGFQMNMINGNTTVTYHYRIRIDTPGTYTLGPAQIINGTQTIESVPISVTVGDQQKSSGAHSGNRSNQAPFMKLTCDKTSAYVGEKINAQLMFYTADATTVLQSVVEPDNLANAPFTIKNKQGQPVTGTQTINGIEYRFARWEFQIYPKQAGALLIPAYSALYHSPSHQPMLSFFFHNDTKRANSNTLTINVQPLPHSYRTPAFIGTVYEYSARINPTQGRVGEGIVLTLAINGDSDFEQMGMVPLNLSEQWKWYESKKYYASDGAYTMEYIIQAGQPGNLAIPAQELFYFDTHEKKYKKISTQPLAVSITGTAAAPAALTIPEDLQPVSNPAALAPNEISPTLGRSFPALAWPLFWACMLILFALWAIIVLITLKKDLVITLFKKIIPQKSPCAIARMQIASAYARKEYGSWYATMNTLLAQRLNQAQVAPDIIENSLLQDGLSASAIADWRLFYAELAESSFYSPKLDTKYYKELAQKIGYWIDVLEKLPRVRL